MKRMIIIDSTGEYMVSTDKKKLYKLRERIWRKTGELCIITPYIVNFSISCKLFRIKSNFNIRVFIIKKLWHKTTMLKKFKIKRRSID